MNAVGYYNLSLKRSYLDNHGVFMINKNILINSFAKVGTTNRKLFGSLSLAASTTQPFSCNPDWITGFVDGEGSFGIQTVKSSMCRLGWTVAPSFLISLHKKDHENLEQIRSYWDVGKITKFLIVYNIVYGPSRNC
jgi:hypothetical protein